ncbi:unnamed protein product [Thlaspi arvense]|uniref:F-box domain-containing protein n=1 Tax=Thlaspi arvense TaxID=13288 RepID=A0AAU9SXI7_THLAR|nr:unnamed protein product [Thlaspi arvense]
MRKSLPLCKKSKTENNSGDAVPLDIVTEVLNRLPAKSVARFMLVSKSWARTIRSKCFIRWFPFGSSTQPLHLLLAFKHKAIDTGHRRCRFFSSPSLSFPSTSIELPTSFLSKIKWPPHQNDSLIECPTYYVKGLVCVGEVICNPCTGKFITLPSFEADISTRFERFFGYDPVNDEYKVLLMGKPFEVPMEDPWPDFRVFTLGAKQEPWREIHCSVPHRPYSRGECIDGAVVSEDIRHWDGAVPTTLVNYHGKVAAAIEPVRDESTIHLFVFEEGKQGFHERSFHNLPYLPLDMKGINRMGEAIFAPTVQNGAARVIRYDLKGASCETNTIKFSEYSNWSTEAMYFVDYVESLMLL